ncbi:MAG: super-infection exclusion protein B [Succinivibrio sp.]
MEKNERNSSFLILNIVMVWLSLATLALLFIPWDRFSPDLAQRIAPCRGFLYLALIFELSNFIAQAIIGAFSSLHRSKRQKERERQMERTVGNMDFSERALIREFVLQRKSELRVPLMEPTVRGLIGSRILEQASPEGEDGKAAVVISRQARPFITYRAIGISAGKLSEEQINQLMSERPEYAKPEPKVRHVYRSGAYKAA